MTPLAPVPRTPAKQDPGVYEDVALDLYPNNAYEAGKPDSATPNLLDPSDIRRYSISPLPQDGRHTPQGSFRGPSPAPPFPLPSRRGGGGFKFAMKSFFLSQWQRNGGPILIVIAQLFGASMNLSTRVLELEDGLHPMQILCARMTSTIVFCFAYMWYQHVPSAPWGPREVRPLLILRACAGFVGLYGMWCSIMFLPLAEATVIGFLAPNVAGYLCRIFLKEPFTKREQLASYLALAGVALITRPTSLFSSEATTTDSDADVAAAMNATVTDAIHKGMDYIPTATERLSGIGMGLLGVVGSALTITVLRTIGPRAHPLISVNYFSMFCTLITMLTLSLAPLLDYDQPGLRFVLPSSLRQWCLLTVIGLCGFSTQFLFTAGLAREKSNRATGMIYTQVLFAAGFDRLVFGQTMGWLSVAGCGMVVGSALWVAIGDSEASGGQKDLVGDLEARGVGATTGGEDMPMLANIGGEHGGVGDDVETEGLMSWDVGPEEGGEV
ncbi:integral membrane protein DUF6 [Seiridium cupressi]